MVQVQIILDDLIIIPTIAITIIQMIREEAIKKFSFLMNMSIKKSDPKNALRVAGSVRGWDDSK